MAIKQLDEHQVRTWSLEQKDRWWLQNVWRGNMPQLTLRSAATGMILGGLLSLTNLYIGAKTGWTLGVGITSVILAFAFFKLLGQLGLAEEFTVLENNAMQSIATAAGYMTAPMISSLAAYMLVTNTIIPMGTTMLWITSIALLGVLFAFPLKRRFINDEQHPFPEGRAAGIVMDALHTSDAARGMFKARILMVAGGGAALLEFLKSGEILAKLKVGWLTIPAYLDGWFYTLSAKWFSWVPSIKGVDLRQLTVRPDTDFVMMAAGGLMGIRVGVSLLVGALVNYLVLAPLAISAGDIKSAVEFSPGQIKDVPAFVATASGGVDPVSAFLWEGFRTNSQQVLLSTNTPEAGLEAALVEELNRTLKRTNLYSEERFAGVPLSAAARELAGQKLNEDERTHLNRQLLQEAYPAYISTDRTLIYGFKRITAWALWGGVAMMTTASLFSFFSKPQILISAFRGLFSRKGAATDSDVLRDIELPMKVFVIGIPIVGALVVFLAHRFFEVQVWMGIIAVPLIFVFTLIGVNSTALTSITPTGALGKLTQLTYGVVAPGNITTNLMTAGITAEVAGNASNLLMDIKPGYLLGAKPRQQAIGHVLGILAGALVAVPVFYSMFLHKGLEGLTNEQYPMPAAMIWKGVAEMLTKGLSQLPATACWAAVIGAILGILFEAVRVLTKGRFWLSAVGIGLAAVIPFNTCFAMFLGSFLFWLAGRTFRRPESKAHEIIVKNQEPICGGVIAGGALMGILLKLITIQLEN